MSEIVQRSDEHLANVVRDDDPLRLWLADAACRKIRSLDWAIQSLLINIDKPDGAISTTVLESMSDLAAFFYLGLFRTLRHFCYRYGTTNPTWIKAPANKQQRIRPADSVIVRNFVGQIRTMVSADDPARAGERLVNADALVTVASSEALPLKTCSVDFVLSSPPYCTRIDYAIATRLELALVGHDLSTTGKDLRSHLIGTPLVRGLIPEPRISWGSTCLRFLDRVGAHDSKASRSYYLKSHLRYFDSMFSSIGQLSRVLKPDCGCVLVVQDSYYKDVHNDLPTILAEMATAFGLALVRVVDYPHARSFGGIHPGRQRYRTGKSAVESVLCFRKE
jgi:hypothetical protein